MTMKYTLFYTCRGQAGLRLFACLLSIMIISFHNPALAEEYEQELLHGETADEHPKTAEMDHDEDHEQAELEFSDAELKEFSIELAHAGPGLIYKTLDLAGEVIVQPDRLYHIVPRVSGVVRQVYKQLGDRVEVGDLLATLSSHELADAKAQFVAADSLLKLVNTNLQW